MQQIDELALKVVIDRAIRQDDEEAASEAHQTLLDLEHKRRVLETVRRCAL